nr:hypothetical protein [Tanacetum cinerariifolium]
MGPTPLSGHATTLLHAFNTETLQDATIGAWNIDTGDLYPVTAPSSIPHVFLISPYTWHQHLGHPGRECDHGGEFDNRNLHKLFADNGIQFCFPCPKTNQQNVETELGPLNYFLDISITRDSSGLFSSQNKYPIELFDMAHMVNCNPSQTPIDTKSKMRSDGDQVSLYMHDPREPHFSALKRILRLRCFPTTRRLTLDVEYRGVSNAVTQTCWLHNLMPELHTPLSSATLVTVIINLVAVGQVRVLHVPSRYQFADTFIKGLSSALFEEFRSSLSVRFPPAPTANE